MRTSLRQLKQEVSSPCPDTIPLRHEISALQNNQNATSYYLEGEIVRMNPLSFRCFSRMHQILVSLLPYTSMPSSAHVELIQLANEFARTLQQFRVFTETTYV